MKRCILSFLVIGVFGIGIGISQTNNSHIVQLETNNFRNIELQTFNGLPRFGRINHHGWEQRSYLRMSSEEQRQVQKLIDADNRHYRGFFVLLERKYMSKIYKYLNTDKFVQNDLRDRGRAFNAIAQYHTKKTAHTLLNTQAFEYFFLQSNPNSAGYGSNFVWGGQQSTSEAKIAKFKEFVDKHSLTIKKAANSIWPEDEGYAYLVSPIAISNAYDIEKKGYWIKYSGANFPNLMASNASSKFIVYAREEKYERMAKDRFKNHLSFEYIPLEEFELALKNTNGKSILIKMPELSPEDKRNQRYLFAVQKVKFTYMGFVANYNSSNTEYVSIGINMDSPKIEFYKEETLENKLFEISLNQSK